MTWCRNLCGVVVLLFTAGLCAAEPEVTALEIHPAQLEFARVEPHQILVTGVTADGRRIDVTRQAEFQSLTPNVATVSPAGISQPVAAGAGMIEVRVGGRTARLPVVVRDGAAVATPSFRHDLLPVLTKFGCNQGACHGKGAGQNGFRLSLRGYAPDWDHQWITREFSGRRISPTAWDESLLLRKPLGETPHAGGRLFNPGSPAAELLAAWLHAGAPGPLKEEPEVAAVRILPGDRTLAVGDEQALLVQAEYTNGERRDVTWLTQFDSNDVGLVEVDRAGRLRVLRPGETAVRGTFEGQVAVVIVTVPYDRPVDPQLFTAQQNFIDEHVFAKLASLRIPPSEPASDAEFLRRVSLDAIGTLPTPDEVRTFLADADPQKRAKAIDRLLARPEFVDYWTLQLADLFQNRKERDHDVRGTKGVRNFHAWLRTQVANNRPWNELAREVLTATGSTEANPAVGYYVVTVGERGDAEQSEVVASVAQAFLGTRIGCAQCHNHPLERYTQDDYFHFAAFFSRLKFERQEPQKGPTTLFIATNEIRNWRNEQKRLRDLIEKEADAAKRAEFEKRIADLDKEIEKQHARPVGTGQPRTGQFLLAQPLDRTPTEIAPGADPRVALADWMTNPANESFRGAFINRIWKHFLGTGLVEPVDDLRASNPPTNPQLWKALGDDFTSHGFDLRHLICTILNSRTYQLSAVTQSENASDTRFYSHYYARRLPAEVLLDAVSQATGVPEAFPGYPVGLRAIQLPDPSLNSYFLGLFGRSERVTACACERQTEVTLPQLLQLQNGESLTQKMQSGEGRLATLLKTQPDNARVIEELFLLTLSRPPSPEESATIAAAYDPSTDRGEFFRDLFWALVNAKDFAFNH